MLNIQFHICDDFFDKYVVKLGLIVRLKLAFINSVVCPMFYFDSVALHCVCFLSSSFYLLHLLRMSLL